MYGFGVVLSIRTPYNATMCISFSRSQAKFCENAIIVNFVVMIFQEDLSLIIPSSEQLVELDWAWPI
jgi:hypothetical protein